MTRQRWEVALDAKDLGSDSLEADLVAELAAHLPTPGRDSMRALGGRTPAVPSPEQLDVMRALIAQAAAIAAMHKLAGDGAVELKSNDEGAAMVSVHHSDAVVAQNLDPAALQKAAAARAASARKVVLVPPKAAGLKPVLAGGSPAARR